MKLTPLVVAVGVAVAALVALVLTGAIRRGALARSIIDVPSERGLHATTTPRGGGLSVVIVTLAFLVAAGVVGWIPTGTVVGIAGGAALVAAVGLMDDVRSMSASVRLVFHFLAAVWATVWLGGMDTLDIGTTTLRLGGAAFVVPVIGMVWATNLFNFMDGSDGLAGTEAVSVATVGGALLWNAGQPAMAMLCFVLAGSCCGFLRWNWSPASIFMGDVASGFLGFMFASIAVAAENVGAVPVMIWAILAAAFIVDATVTFARRLRLGKWREPHRTHAYQRLISGGWTHAQVAASTAGLNVVLAVLAISATARSDTLSAVTLVAFGIVAALYVWVDKTTRC